MQRLSAILTGLLVLTFSFSGWSNVCASMSHKSQMEHGVQVVDGGSDHHTSSPSHSHHTRGTGTGTGTGSDHCQHASSCTSSTSAPASLSDTRGQVKADRIVHPDESLPSSQSPDLEPPPPKA